MPSRSPYNPSHPPTSASPSGHIHPAAIPFPAEGNSPYRIPQDAPGQASMTGNPATSPPYRRGHSRSISHPFPSPFGGIAKRRNRSISKKDNFLFDSDDEDDDEVTYLPDPHSSSPRKGPPRPIAAEEMTSGKCMVCNSTVRWPRNLKVFRCTECLTVNDLEPYVDSDKTGSHGISGNDGKAPTPVVPRKAIPLSVERTKTILDECLSKYLQQLLDIPQQQNPSLENYSGKRLEIAQDENLSQSPNQSSGYLSEPRQPVDPRGGSSSTSSKPMKLDTMGGIPNYSKPNLTPSYAHGERKGSQMRSRDAQNTPRRDRSPRNAAPLNSSDAKIPTRRTYIFRSLEEYIITSFKGCDCLNSSFTTVQPTLQTADHSSPPKQKAEPSSAQAPSQVAFEPDPKLLLLGDIAENSSWWMNEVEQISSTHPSRSKERREKSSSSSRPVSSRSPRINWAELAQWHNMIMIAGTSWVELWSTMKPLEVKKEDDVLRAQKWDTIDLAMVDREITESRLHLHRTLLKATENLLKRPRRPLKKPEDIRFLLMLLTNPLIHPSSPALAAYTLTPSAARSDRRPSHPKDGNSRPAPRDLKPPPKLRSSGPGHHFGIIKRIMGLLANLPNDCHHYLVSWFSRFSAGQFEKIVDLAGSFVTHRLARQHGRKRSESAQHDDSLVPSFSSAAGNTPAELHAAINGRSPNKPGNEKRDRPVVYTDDWQVRAAARVMSLLFTANNASVTRKPDGILGQDAGPAAKHQASRRGHMIPISSFYNTLLDYSDLVADFEAWESKTTKFSFCQYPFFLSIWAKIHILEHDARRQMEVKAREAFFNSIMSRTAISQYLVLKVRRDCLVEDSLRGVSEVVGSSQEEIKKGLRIEFLGEEGVDAGGLRKEWFLLLVREIFDPHHGLFIYDDDSRYCYFNPYCFESSEQFFLVGVLLGLAIYNSTILDIALPPFAFKKLLAAAPLSSITRPTYKCSLDDLAELRPALAKGLRALLEFEGDVTDTFCYDFVAQVDRYGEVVPVPLCAGGENRPVTNANRREFVDLYVHYLLDTAVTRQFEPFKRGFFTVCGGNALSLFRPEEIELLVRGSDEPLDVASLRAVATYDNWSNARPETEPVVRWFWDFFEQTQPQAQRKILSFVTGSDRIPAMGATSLSIRLVCLGDDSSRFPTARTCFNQLGLYRYETRERLEQVLWDAVLNSEGFGLK
ncbi:HECT-domain-containing protein [Aspergillus sclerotioniger CBS 115572]|uniref:HECT-type E3 ubiquitin transferase n=1 Tax=Aspergillus sclerotioniger CBS 115572 TaxID=1450535 RepID=A0A317XBU3_9EURO|nr:HECT-domain-containing protein [Aspergillus sclerotioniger CBS 115572]PWY95581.1 HECT-domain-containing protein [Aspergillus sclerotioniger CBS 115572]